MTDQQAVRTEAAYEHVAGSVFDRFTSGVSPSEMKAVIEGLRAGGCGDKVFRIAPDATVSTIQVGRKKVVNEAATGNRPALPA